MIQVKRANEPASAHDGKRFLVERLWPRGMKKENLRMDGWLKDVAPSDELRRWFAHDPAKGLEFQRRYRPELRTRSAAIKPLRTAARRGRVTLLYSAHDVEHNNAIVPQGLLGAENQASDWCEK